MNSFQIKYVFVLLLLLYTHPGLSQPLVDFISARQLSLGGITSVGEGVDGMNGNPAIISNSKVDGSILISSEKRFFSDILSTNLAFVHQVGQNDFAGLGISSLGFDALQFLQLRFVYSRKIGHSTHLGGSLSFHQLTIDDYGGREGFRVGLGWLNHWNDHIQTGAFFERSTDVDTPGLGQLTLETGVRIEIAANLHLVSGVAKNEDDLWNVRMGFSYKPTFPVTFHLGILSNPFSPSIGVELYLDHHLRVNVGTHVHPVLGETMALSIQWSW